MCSFSNYLVEVCKEKAIVAFARASLHYALVSGLVRTGLDHVRWSKLTQVEIDRSNAMHTELKLVLTHFRKTEKAVVL